LRVGRATHANSIRLLSILALSRSKGPSSPGLRQTDRRCIRQRFGRIRSAREPYVPATNFHLKITARHVRVLGHPHKEGIVRDAEGQKDRITAAEAYRQPMRRRESSLSPVQLARHILGQFSRVLQILRL
jgi:hypothetical protein